ncbi:hypothetical protein [Enterococcus sp. CSURQ0835]|uniref:hypothetical protein n=1 Tax=Enterococcus sp. CSURQ0835 TaxID=2681394 RepID=UPI001358F52D|nr:hypothetical protein [Enterococcus sp. CSURQ0835]
MSLILTIVIDVLAVGLFIYQLPIIDQIIVLFSCVIQTIFLIDLVAVMLLRNKTPKPITADTPKASRSTRKLSQNPNSPFKVWLIRISVLVNLAFLLYYAYQLYAFFH